MTKIFRRTKKVLRGIGKLIKIATITASIVKVGLWISRAAKSEQKSEGKKAKAVTPKKAKKVKIK